MAGKMLGIAVKWAGQDQKYWDRAGKRLQSTVNSVVGDVAHDASRYIKDTFLQGRALKKLTGETYDSVQAFYDKQAKTWYAKVGVGVSGHLNYLFKWIGTSKEFMKPGWAEYLAMNDGRIADNVLEAVEKL